MVELYVVSLEILETELRDILLIRFSHKSLEQGKLDGFQHCDQILRLHQLYLSIRESDL